MKIGTGFKDGGTGPKEIEFLINRAIIADITIEIGCWHGATTKILAQNTPGVVYAVDPWLWLSQPIDIFREYCSEELASGKIVEVRMYSDEAFDKIFNENFLKNVDLVFIDGNHSYACVKKDIANYRQLIKTGGILCGDYETEKYVGLRRAIHEAFPEGINLHGRVWWKESKEL